MPSKYLNDARTGELIQKIYTADRAIATECKSYTDTNYLPLTGGTLTGAVNGVTPTAGDESTKLATTAYVQEELRQHASMPIGHEYFTMNPNVPQGSLPLFGGEYSRATYADLWAWVQEQTGYLKTEIEWQTLSVSNNGNVPYYSDGDGLTTFRVPSLKCWVKAANGTVTEVGSYVAAGLPNITGKMGPFLNNVISGGGSYTQGVFTMSATGSTMDDVSRPNPPQNLYGFNFDASRSSSIYGNSTTVQPESIVGMWLVKAYGTIEDTGVIDEQAYIDDRFNASKQYTDTEVSTGVPTGVVQAFAGSNTPTGWLLCDGSAVSRTTYAALFAVIGTTYGAGNGSTTFNLPNLVDKFVEGSATSGTVKNAGLPDIKGSINLRPWGTGAGDAASDLTEAFQSSSVTSAAGAIATSSAGNHLQKISFSASRSSSVYGNSTTVQPPALTMRYIIKT